MTLPYKVKFSLFQGGTPMEANFCNLKTTVFRLERQTELLKQTLAQAKYDLREAKARQLEYSGSFRSFLDKLSGKQEQKLYELSSNQKRAEALLAERGRELGDVSQKLEEARAMLSSLSNIPDPKNEARYCIEYLTAMLPEADQALTAMGDLMRGAEPGQIISRDQRQLVYGEAEQKAAACSEILKQLETALSQLQISFELPACYRNPVAYLANATEYTRRDRLNELTRQTVAIQKQLPTLLRQLEE